MKKKVISILLVGAMVAGLAACGGSSSSSSSSNDGSAAAEGSGSGGDEHTLTVYAWDPSFNIPALEAAAKDYQTNVDPDFVLDIQEQSGSEDVQTAITTAASAGNYSTLPDLVLFQDHQIEQYVANYPDAWQNVDDADIVWDNFSQEKLAYSTIDGVHYGVPVDAGTVICAYRVDILQECGYTIDDLTGITWDRFIEIGEDVYNKTGKYMASINSDGNDYFYMMLQAEGVSQFEDGEPNIADNETFAEIFDVLTEMCEKNVMYLANSWSDYTDQVIGGDMVAGIMNGNWIIPTIEKVEANSGQWEITTMPTLSGEEGYAANGGSSLYITANCQNTDLAKDFLAYTFGGGSYEKTGTSITYDEALTNGGVISTYTPATTSDVYSAGVAFFNDTPIYEQIGEYTAKVPTLEQSEYHYRAREYVGNALINVTQQGANADDEIANAEEQLRFEMGL